MKRQVTASAFLGSEEEEEVISLETLSSGHSALASVLSILMMVRSRRERTRGRWILNFET